LPMSLTSALAMRDCHSVSLVSVVLLDLGGSDDISDSTE
jgi:hypothetical protein